MIARSIQSLLGMFFRFLRSLWIKIPHDWRHEIWTFAGEDWQSFYARQQIARPAKQRPVNTNAPLVVAGLFNTANGIGEAARTTYRALEAAGLNPIAVDLSEPFAPVDMQTDIPCVPMPEDQEGILILQLNGPETMSAMQHLGMGRGRSWYTIGYWAWELPTFPDGWDKAFKYLSEIWTISAFTAAALRQHEKAPQIHVFGHAIAFPKGLRSARTRHGWKKAETVFLTMADSMSSMQRKNPIAAIRAFRDAFGEDPRCKLVVKTRNLDRHETAQSSLLEAIDGAPNIDLLDVSLSESEMWRLMKSVDALISLHRSEGFGLVIAEAMALGKAVICTGWSGNMDFTTADTAMLVKSSPIPCEDQYGIYLDSEAHWAEPDHQDAVEKLRQVADGGEAIEQMTKRASDLIRSWADPQKVGEAMKRRLETLPTAQDLKHR